MVRSKTTRPQILVIMTAIFFVVLGTSVSFGASPGEGQLTVIEPDGKPGANCPLEHTSVKAEVSGFLAKVEVKQVFRNPGQEKIEAVYTFPLSANGAVDEMLMKIGDKVVSGEIKRREDHSLQKRDFKTVNVLSKWCAGWRCFDVCARRPDIGGGTLYSWGVNQP